MNSQQGTIAKEPATSFQARESRELANGRLTMVYAGTMNQVCRL